MSLAYGNYFSFITFLGGKISRSLNFCARPLPKQLRTFLGVAICGLWSFPSPGASVPQKKANRWLPPQVQSPRSPGADQTQASPMHSPARVRIGLKLAAFKKKPIRQKTGPTQFQFVQLSPLRHTLRARMNRVNHFFVGSYHIETKPLKWVRQSRRYAVKLKIYRRYGAFGQLEEYLGDVDVNGVLKEHQGRVYNLYGSAHKRFRNKWDQPILDVVAGYRPGPAARHVSQNDSLQHRSPPPPAAAVGSQPNPAVRGRF